MPSSTRASRLQTAVENIQPNSHVCLIYRNQDEQFESALPFIKAGIMRGEQTVYITDDNLSKAVKQAMLDYGLDLENDLASGKLIMAGKKESYLRDGHFDPDAMLGFLAQSVEQAERLGFSSLRVTGEMTWALGSNPGNERLLEYEAKLNMFFVKHNCSAICQYNIERFSPETIRDVLYTHPIAIIGGVVCKNFYYKPPEEFLASPPNPKIEVDRMIGSIYEFEQRERELLESRAQLELLNEQLESEVIRRTDYLEKQSQALRELNRQMVGREYRIRELVRENEQLNSRIDQLMELQS
jgi:two-component system, chemotaxis family, sensor kinase Cph1